MGNASFGWQAATGVTEKSVIGRIYADIRAFRSYDGPSEARRALRRVQQAPDQQAATWHVAP
jgi:hypothetical protein